MFDFIKKLIVAKQVFFTLLIGVILAGIYSYIQLPRYAYTEFKVNKFAITVSHADFSADYIDKQVVQSLEAHIKNLPGVEFYKFSIHEDGYTVGKVTFSQQEDFDDCRQALLSVVDIVKQDHDLVFTVKSADYNSSHNSARMMMILGQNELSRELFLEVLQQIRHEINDLSEVSKVKILGLPQDKLVILLDPVALEQYSVDMNTIFQLLKSQSITLPKVELYDDSFTESVMLPIVNTPFRNAYDVMQLKLPLGSQVKAYLDQNHLVSNLILDDVANMYIDNEPNLKAFLNQTRAFEIDVYSASNSNIVALSQQVRKIISKYQEKYRISCEFFVDLGLDVKDQTNNLTNTILTAIITNAFLIVLFVGLQFGLSVIFSIPITFLFLFIFLYLLDMSINFMSLFACILSTGLIVDNAIIISDMTQVNLRKGMSLTQSYISTLQNIFTAIVSANLTTICVFLPMWLISSDLFSQRLVDVSLPIALSLLISMFVSMVIMPVLTILLFAKADKTFTWPQRLIGKLEHCYNCFLRLIMSRTRGILLSCGFLFIFCSWGLFVILSNFGNFIQVSPDVVSTHLVTESFSSNQISKQDNQLLIRQMSDRFLNLPDIKYLVSFYQDINHVQYYLKLVDKPLRKIDDNAQYMKLLRSALPEKNPDVVWKFRTGGHIGAQGSDYTTMTLQILANDLSNLNRSVRAIKDHLSTMSAMIDVQHITADQVQINENITANNQVPKLFLHKNKLVEHLQNVSIHNVTRYLQVFTRNGLKLDELHVLDHEDKLPVYVKFDNKYNNFTGLMNLKITNSQGVQKPLSEFLELKFSDHVPNIFKVEGQYVHLLHLPLLQNASQAKILQDLNAMIERNKELSNVTVKKFDHEGSDSSFISFYIKSLAVSIFLVVLILFIQFGNFWHMLIGVINLFLCVLTTLLFIWFTVGKFNLEMSGVGILCLIGIMVNNNIVLIHTYNQLKKQNLPLLDRVVATCVMRLRPIMLTTLTTVVSIVPIVFGAQVLWTDFSVVFNAMSTEVFFDFALAFSAGMLIGMITTLLSTPLLLIIGEQAYASLRRKFMGDEPDLNRRPSKPQSDTLTN